MVGGPVLIESCCLNIPTTIITVLDMNKIFGTISWLVNLVMVTLVSSLIIIVASPCPAMFINWFVAVAACSFIGLLVLML